MSAAAIIPSTKLQSSLNFSSGTAKRKVADETENGKSWEEVIKRAKVDKELEEETKVKTKENLEKAKRKKSAKDKKAIGMLSFTDE